MFSFLISTKAIIGLYIFTILVVIYLGFSLRTFYVGKKENKLLINLTMMITFVVYVWLVYLACNSYGTMTFVLDIFAIFCISAVYTPNMIIKIYKHFRKSDEMFNFMGGWHSKNQT